MKTKLVLAVLTATMIAGGGFAIAQDDDSDDSRRDRRSGSMLDRVAKTLDLDESQQAAFVTFTETVRAQFPDRGERRSSDDDGGRQATREALQAEREARQEALESILINPEFDIVAFKALQDEGSAQREERMADIQVRVEEFRSGADERSNVILTAYAEFHRTLSDEQRQKLVWLSEQRGGAGILAGQGGSFGGGPGDRGRGDRRNKGGKSFR